jgi:hypothetical protein
VNASFTDHAAARAFEHDVDHEAVIEALGAPHYTQPAREEGRDTHFVKADGRPLKVVTGPNYLRPGETAIITVVPLDVGLP